MTGTHVFLLLVMFVGYFIPTIVAICRSHKNGSAIVILNLLLGWLLIPWVIALVWSFTDYVEKKDD